MFKLADLPYGYDALQPTMSAETLHLHHDKHHAKYVATVNQLLEGKPEASASLEDVVLKARQTGEKKLFNNAAQAWNHAFFWACMSPVNSAPSGDLANAVEGFSGGLAGLRGKFVEEGAVHFGSGWVWLAAAGGALQVLSTHDGENLLAQADHTPLLVCDLWEHAYYVDYKNDREAFLKAWFDRLSNWDFAGRQWAAAAGSGSPWRYA